MRGRRGLAGLLVAACVGTVLTVGPPAEATTLLARGSVNQVQVIGATPDAALELWQGGAEPVRTGTADSNGTFIFGIDPEPADDVPRGSGYSVTEVGGDTVPVTAPDWGAAPPPAEVLGPEDVPPQSFYDDQALPDPVYEDVLELGPEDDDGYGYVTTRDGTTLAVNVLAPYDPFDIVAEPYPTIINYSGYEPAFPGDNDPVTVLLRAAGFAVVGVNLRGTGCSGGAYSYFEALQGLDGYDVVEAVAAQDWVGQAPGAPGFDAGPMVGMAGISFPGISQLFVGRTDPPSLAAISPLSVLADSYRSTLYPGGILNDGFAESWVEDREGDSEPAGQPWAADRIAGLHDPADSVCAENQELKLNAPPLVARFAQDLLYTADPGDDLAPATFVDEIQVPTFVAGAFQDEQTGGHWPTMLDAFPAGVVKRAVLFNGTHADALGPDVLRDLLEFLDLYVARRAPQTKPLLRRGAPEQFADTFGEPYALAPFHGNQGTGLADPAYRTQTAYEGPDQDPVRIYWERGAHDSPHCFVDTGGSIVTEVREECDDVEGRGSLFGRFETTHDAWPLAEAAPVEWYLHPDGALDPAAPTVPDAEARGWSSYAYDNSRDQVGTFDGGTEAIWHKDAAYTWEQPPEAASLRYVSAPFDDTQAYAGTGSVDLWLRSTAPDVDLEVTLTEVRPDGEETYVQSGWLRASHRQEAPGSTALDPVHTHLTEEPLPAGEFVPVRVELFPFTHVLRLDSRLALTISAPGGNRPFWLFASEDAPPGTVNDIGHSVGRPSRLTLPAVDLGGAAPTTRPDCGDLRAQPCRTVAPSTRPTAVTATLDPGDTEAALDRGIDVDWTAPAVAGVTSYEVGVLPSGQVLVDDGVPGYRVSVADGDAPPPGSPAFTVTAEGPPDALASDASLSVLPEHPFTDVSRSAWNVDAVDWVAAWQVAEGFADGTFRNGASVTRGQFVAWLWTMFGRPEGSPPHGFSDVGPNAWMADALSWASAEDIVAGFADGTFRPASSITRGQVVQWLWVAAGSAEADDHPFVDVARTAWNVEAVDWASANDVVAGFADDTFRNAANATRGQAATWFEATAAFLAP